MQTIDRPRTAFASYASPDRADVERSVQGIETGAANLDVFIDVDKLRAGQDWLEKINAYISTSDILYLFWSRNAAKSQWVDKEWRLGFQLKGLPFISPFPLESPELVPPPAELSSLHFNDRHLMFIMAQRYIDQQKQTRRLTSRCPALRGRSPARTPHRARIDPRMPVSAALSAQFQHPRSQPAQEHAVVRHEDHRAFEIPERIH